MQNEAQYDLDRKAAKISALSSNNLDKYEYLTSEDLGLKPSAVEQAKFDYSPLGKIFNKGLDTDEDKKEGLLKRLKNIEDKNEELLNAFSATNKVSKAPKNESDYNYNSKCAIYEFYRDFKKFLKMLLDSKYDVINDFYKLLNPFINTHKAIITETKDRKDKIMNHVKPPYANYFDASKKNYDNKELTDEDKKKYGYKQLEIFYNKDQRPKLTEKEKTETKKN